MNAFSAALDILFADANLAEDVIYTPLAGTPVTVRASFSMADEVQSWGQADFVGPRRAASVRVADVPIPKRGDRIERADGAAYLVQHWITDDLRLSHKLHLAEA